MCIRSLRMKRPHAAGAVTALGDASSLGCAGRHMYPSCCANVKELPRLHLLRPLSKENEWVEKYTQLAFA